MYMYNERKIHLFYKIILLLIKKKKIVILGTWNYSKIFFKYHTTKKN